MRSAVMSLCIFSWYARQAGAGRVRFQGNEDELEGDTAPSEAPSILVDESERLKAQFKEAFQHYQDKLSEGSFSSSGSLATLPGSGQDEPDIITHLMHAIDEAEAAVTSGDDGADGDVQGDADAKRMLQAFLRKNDKEDVEPFLTYILQFTALERSNYDAASLSCADGKAYMLLVTKWRLNALIREAESVEALQPFIQCSESYEEDATCVAIESLASKCSLLEAKSERAIVLRTYAEDAFDRKRVLKELADSDAAISSGNDDYGDSQILEMMHTFLRDKRDRVSDPMALSLVFDAILGLVNLQRSSPEKMFLTCDHGKFFVFLVTKWRLEELIRGGQNTESLKPFFHCSEQYNTDPSCEAVVELSTKCDLPSLESERSALLSAYANEYSGKLATAEIVEAIVDVDVAISDQSDNADEESINAISPMHDFLRNEKLEKVETQNFKNTFLHIVRNIVPESVVSKQGSLTCRDGLLYIYVVTSWHLARLLADHVSEDKLVAFIECNGVSAKDESCKAVRHLRGRCKLPDLMLERSSVMRALVAKHRSH
eukprot:TRINITY_DN29509_c0_g1_i1.p1 TRINITY_DN29509_c0_g1~~TRINITY_DN29509_c0_g1_i1.p1  ORF type:complete len:545 (+),score=83.91 TRINITY_DN29509_c0_g1_i1:53-1687(+)